MDYTAFKDLVMAAAKSHGLTDYELYAAEETGIGASALNHTIDGFSTSSEHGACFRCIADGKIGYAATELYTDEEALRIVEDAMNNAGILETSESAVLHETGDAYAEIPEIITTEPSAQELTSFVLTMQEAAHKKDNRVVNGSRSFISYVKNTTSLANSKGLDLSYTRSYAMSGAMTSVLADGEMYVSMGMKVADFKDLDSVAVAEKSVEDACSTIGAEPPLTAREPVVFSNKMAATMLSVFSMAFSGESAQQGLSRLAGMEGQTVAADKLTIVDDPDPEGWLFKAPFDAEGVATYKKDVIKQGELKTLLHNMKTAQKAGTASTGNASKSGYASPVSVSALNLYIDKGPDGSKEDVLSKVGHGVYITGLNGTHAGANAVTGDFSLSSEGFMIEDGKLGRPVKNFTIAGNFYEMIKDVSYVGNDLELQPPMHSTACYGAPTVAVKELAVAGK